VLGGEIETEDGRIARAGQRGKQTTAGDDPDDPVRPPAAAPDAGAASATRPGSEKAAGKGKPERDPYRAQLARHHDRIRTCFNQNATTVSGAPELALSLSIDEGGSVQSATLVPADLEGTALGECLLGVARGVSFGKQAEEVKVTIPLKVKRRSK